MCPCDAGEKSSTNTQLTHQQEIRPAMPRSRIGPVSCVIATVSRPGQFTSTIPKMRHLQRFRIDQLDDIQPQLKPTAWSS